ncbi:MAG: metallophosphoesterase [Gaiellaceae bacterium]
MGPVSVSPGRATVRVAAAGDIHCGVENRGEVERAFASIEGEADLILLAGDLTTHGGLDEARVLADVCRGFPLPVVAVLGNHDCHSDRAGEIAEVLTGAGVTVLERSSVVLAVRGTSVGVAGAKGFIGGFDSPWANFGEAVFREAYAETTADVEGLNAALESIHGAEVRIALLHYAPVAETLRGEPEQLWLVLGSDRLAVPIAAHRPDLVLHGHAHRGSFEGSIDGVPVYNVAVHVMGRPFWVFELEARDGVSRVAITETA